MTKKQSPQLILMAAVLSGLVLLQATDAAAARRVRRPRGRHPHRYFHGYHHRPYRRSLFSFPGLFSTTVVYSGPDYYYANGYYYQKVPSGYVIVEPPIGSTVKTLPRGYETVYIRGVKYYTHNGLYYVKQRNNYIVVNDPLEKVVDTVQEAKVIEGSSLPAITAAEEQGSFTVNIPNAQGGYTSVTIQKTEDGFIGPQGEFYSEFPTVAQLQVMYGA